MVRIKMLLVFDFDPETGEYTPVSREIINEGEAGAKKAAKETTAKRSKSKSKLPESSEPLIILEDNKYILNDAAAEALCVEPDDRIDIKYEKQGKLLKPVIGSNEVFGTKGGNKLTQSLTVSCRGKANETLSAYGSQFKLVPHPNRGGLFFLVGDKAQAEPEVADEKIDLSEIDNEPNEDIPLDVELANMVADDSVEEDTITKFDFTFN